MKRLVIDRLPLALRLRHYRPVIIDAFEAHGVPGSWGLAIARQESGFRAGAVNQYHPGDARRGGAWGLCQMTLRTAQLLGFHGTGNDLLDPWTCCDLAATLVAQHRDRWGDDNLADVASAYNSGQALHKAPESTRERYVPAVLRFAEEYGWRAPPPKPPAPVGDTLVVPDIVALKLASDD